MKDILKVINCLENRGFFLKGTTGKIVSQEEEDYSIFLVH